MKVVSVSNPVYSNEANTTINCVVVFDGGKFAGQPLPYTAAAHDPEDHGQELWNGLMGGSYGSIEKYVAPIPTDEQLAEQLVGEAKMLLTRSDAVAMRCFKAGVEFPDEWRSYIKTLRDLIAKGAGSIPKTPSYPSET